MPPLAIRKGELEYVKVPVLDIVYARVLIIEVRVVIALIRHPVVDNKKVTIVD